MPDRPQKITFADMRDMGVRDLLIYCSDYKCSHLVTMSRPWTFSTTAISTSGRPGPYPQSVPAPLRRIQPGSLQY